MQFVMKPISLRTRRSWLQYQLARVITVHAEVKQDFSDSVEYYTGLDHPPVDSQEEEDDHEQGRHGEQRMEPEGGEEGHLGCGGVPQPIQGPHRHTH